MLENDSCTHTDGTTIRSKYRGLSWDKKYQGWRVRIFFAGKQRHIGRYSEEAAAARAYDKAAVYLYGRNAITNCGLEACQRDQTEVSEFIVMAKKLVQDQMAANYKRRQHNSQHSMHSMPDRCQQQLLRAQGACAPMRMPGLQASPMQAHVPQGCLAGQLVPQHAQQQLRMQPSMSAQHAEQQILLQPAAWSPPPSLQALHVASCQPQFQQAVLIKSWPVSIAQPCQQQDMITASVYPAGFCPAATVSTAPDTTWGPAQAATEISMSALSFGGACAAPISTVQACALSTAHSSMGSACAEPGITQVMHPQQPIQQQVWASTAACSQPGLQQQQTQGMLLQAMHAGPVVTSNCSTMIGQQQLQGMFMQQGPAVAPVPAGVLGPVPTISIAGGMPPACMQEQWTVPAQLIF